MSAAAPRGARRNIARGALIVSGLALVLLLAPATPRTQELRVVLDRETADEDRELTLDILTPADEPVAGARVLVPAGRTLVSHTTELRSGQYVLHLRLNRPASAGPGPGTIRTFRVDLHGQPTTLHLHGRQ